MSDFGVLFVTFKGARWYGFVKVKLPNVKTCAIMEREARKVQEKEYTENRTKRLLGASMQNMKTTKTARNQLQPNAF